MAKYERIGSVYGKKKESAWPAVVGVVIFFIVIGAIFG